MGADRIQLPAGRRQRVTRDLFDRRRTVADPVWVNRRLLLTAAEHLSPKQLTRLTRMLDDHDPTNEIGAAWAAKERLAHVVRRA